MILVTALGYSLNESLSHLRALWPGASEGRAVAAPVAQLDRDDSVESAVGGGDGDKRADFDSSDTAPDESSAAGVGSGPPSGVEFARLVEQGLLEDLDPAAAEPYLRALREAAEQRE